MIAKSHNQRENQLGGASQTDSKERIYELERLMTEVMRWMDVTVSGKAAAALCDRMEDLLNKTERQKPGCACGALVAASPASALGDQCIHQWDHLRCSKCGAFKRIVDALPAETP